MNPFPIDAYAYSNRLRHTHPGEKILFAGMTILICLFSGSLLVSAVALLMVTLAITRGAGISLRAFWYFLRLPLGFIVVGVITIAVTMLPPDGGGAFVSLPVGPWQIGVTPASLQQAGRILAVSLASVGASLFMALTTPMVDLADQLRRWHVPALFVELMTLVYRFIFVLIETAQAMHVAQEARLGYTTAGRSLRSVGMLASNLYLRANARASALFTALTARGYTGDLTVLRTEPVWSTRHLLFIAAADGLLLALALTLGFSTTAISLGGLF
ncbi:MAG TPA: cobalt ECF transporter T component CbiQ [Chloroflexota bacterium]|nr:cobalt ECF transporter T component CbiQ [Chloroflexota bacterium]